MNIRRKYAALLGRQPDEGERARLDRIADALELNDDDALWSVLIALEDYDRRYRAVPRQIEAAVQKSLDAAVAAVRKTAEQEARRASAAATERMAEEAARIGREIAARTAGADRARWILGAVVVCTLALIAVGGGSFHMGHRTGAAAADAASAWAMSAEGRLARRLAEVGSLRRVATCDAPEWAIERDDRGRRICLAGGRYGWFIP